MPSANQRRRVLERSSLAGGLLPESPREARRQEESEPPPNPIDACSEAAARLNVIIKMLHDDYCERLRPADGAERRAYGEMQVADGLRGVRNLLKACIRGGERRRAS